MLLLQFFPNMAGLQPPTLQNVFAFQVHSGEFVQIIHVRNNHWCLVSTAGCQSGVVCVYETLSEETVYLIASMVHVPSFDIKIEMMDVEKQFNGSNCGFLAIPYAFDIINRCSVRGFITGHISQLVSRIAWFLVFLFWESESVSRESQRHELHCTCRMPEDKFAECDSCHIWYHQHCMDIPREVFVVHWECKRCVKQLGT